ncbi:uncharacterized protein B0T15DRAFT_502952 [Chaetomium strumarium]|uniref:Hydrophobin n=1 Tax=Chaetomium strumarium TaxID=1170767 RepID=A0AAJ0M1V4_9PEZI|nr:hypothetical protein B0T15DRAFT_502952 [Chaetomium strumarium]
MQFSNLFTVLALAMTATALPAAENVDVLAERTDTPPPAKCNSSSTNVCCQGGILGNILCAVSILGGSCTGQAYCCQTDAPAGVLINIQLLNCVKLIN